VLATPSLMSPVLYFLKMSGLEPYKEYTERKQCQMSFSKKIDLYRDFAAGVLGFYLSEASSAPVTPSSPPPYNCIRVNSVFIHTGKGGNGEI
jgi:hypothetical protein